MPMTCSCRMLLLMAVGPAGSQLIIKQTHMLLTFTLPSSSTSAMHSRAERHMWCIMAVRTIRNLI